MSCNFQVSRKKQVQYLTVWIYLTILCSSGEFELQSGRNLSHEATLEKLCLKVLPSDFIQNMSQSPSKCLKQWINWIISKMHHSIWIFCFVLGVDEYLDWKEKLESDYYWLINLNFQIKKLIGLASIVVWNWPSKSTTQSLIFREM